MAQTPPVRSYTRSPAATAATRVALTALFVALGVALAPFNVPIFGARAFPVQSMLNVLGAVFLGPAYTVLAALIISVIRNALGLGTPLAYLGSMIGALLASLAYRAVMGRRAPDAAATRLPPRALLALLAAALGEVAGTGILAAVGDAAIVAPAVLGKAVVLTIYMVPFLLAAVVGSAAGVVAVIALWSAGVRPRAA